MKIRFFADDFNARFVWGWKNGEYVTDDAQEIEYFTGLGIRSEEELTEAEIKKYTKKAIKDIKRIKAKEVN